MTGSTMMAWGTRRRPIDFSYWVVHAGELGLRGPQTARVDVSK